MILVPHIVIITDCVVLQKQSGSEVRDELGMLAPVKEFADLVAKEASLCTTDSSLHVRPMFL